MRCNIYRITYYSFSEDMLFSELFFVERFLVYIFHVEQSKGKVAHLRRYLNVVQRI